MAMPADSGHKAVIRKYQKKEEENVRGGDEHRIQQRRITFEESEKLTELTRQGAVSDADDQSRSTIAHAEVRHAKRT